ncbi:MAG TPA: hypothetical protein DDX54_00185 [Rhodospirillaceae bacterium]|jgi:KDO2-lipid IV(A) lauroyltransferase|nr:lysophospholipid acyltransferase family protein [Alphaproteobacteria bacterium]HBH25812.1 hypothetical protein [Rhodospirillaceae bacterium]
MARAPGRTPSFATRAAWACEGAALTALFWALSLLPVAWASGLIGGLARTFGPCLPQSRRAAAHMAWAMPDLPEGGRNKAIADMWDNLGRVIAEYPHLRTIVESRVTVEGAEIARAALASGRGALFVSGHLANWEVLVPFFIHMTGAQMALTYRKPNNPWVARLLARARWTSGVEQALSKGDRVTAPRLVQTLRNGGVAGMLADQKYNEGPDVPFFGRPARTNPAPVRLARRYGAALILVSIRRLPCARFVITIAEPLEVAGRSDESVLADINAHMERWIRAEPGQWLWLHRRWGRNGF